MIKRAAQMETEVRSNMRGGKGDIPITHIMKQVQMTGKCRLFAKMVIQPGDSIGLHPHENEEEIYYILKGKGLMEDNGIKQEVNAGDATLTGNGASHSIENIGTEPLEVLAVILLYQ